MMRPNQTRWALAAALLGVMAAGRAQTFSHYETTDLANSAIVSDSGQSAVTFQMGADTGVWGAGGGSDVVLANLDVFSEASQLDPFNAPWDITVHLGDETSGDATDLLFTGFLFGSVRDGALPASNLSVVFDEPMSRSVMLGQALYNVSIGPFTPPGPVGSGRTGAIGAHVKATYAIPEPSTLALLALAGTPLVARALRPQRKTSTPWQ